MKKFFVMIAVAMTMGLASCGNKNGAQVADQQDTEVASAADATIENATAEIAAQLEAGDASKLQQAIEAAKVKVQELLQDNPEMAKEYLTKVQNFLKENAERVKAVVGDNAVVQTAVSALTDMPVDNILESLQALGADGQQAAEQAAKLVEEAPDAVKEAANQKIEEGKEAVKEKAKEKLNEEADKALKQLGL